MAVPNPEEWINNLSLEKILDLDLTGFVDLFFLIIMIAIYSIVIFNCYRTRVVLPGSVRMSILG